MLRNFQDPVLPHPLVLCQELPAIQSQCGEMSLQSSRTLQVTIKIRFVHGNWYSVQLVLSTCLYVQSVQISASLRKALLRPDFPRGKTKQKKLCFRLALCVVGETNHPLGLGVSVTVDIDCQFTGHRLTRTQSPSMPLLSPQTLTRMVSRLNPLLP